tara:strand:- start:783 stop:1463 length:681 start_codon:yes stop_codon:yes gene_type:complete
MGKVGAYAPAYSVTPEKREYITKSSGNSQKVASSYVTTALENPAATYTGIVGDKTAVYDDETGILTIPETDDNNKETYDLSKKPDGSYNKPEQVKNYLTDLLQSDITLGNTQQDRDLKAQVFEELNKLEVDNKKSIVTAESIAMDENLSVKEKEYKILDLELGEATDKELGIYVMKAAETLGQTSKETLQDMIEIAVLNSDNKLVEKLQKLLNYSNQTVTRSDIRR